jgi:hypothetical protein
MEVLAAQNCRGRRYLEGESAIVNASTRQHMEQLEDDFCPSAAASRALGSFAGCMGQYGADEECWLFARRVLVYFYSDTARRTS